MGVTSSIEWTDASWSPIRARNLRTGKVGWHCEHATTGCEFCYAEGMNLRLGTRLPFKPGHRKDIEIFLDEEMLLAPLRWKKPRMIFVCSMTDAFADFVTDEWIDKVFAVMALAPQHTFQVLTKRAERMLKWSKANSTGGHIFHVADNLKRGFHPQSGCWPLPNVWLGVSAERQQEADERIPQLLATPAAVRFVSLEPLLGPIDLRTIYTGATSPAFPNGEPSLANLDWIIVGGESGKNARPMHPDWARSLRDQCEAAGVPFFFKQWGEWWEVDSDSRDEDGNHYLVDEQTLHEGFDKKLDCMISPDGRVFRDWEATPEGVRCRWMTRLGKKAAGRLLDGKTHDAFPMAAS